MGQTVYGVYLIPPSELAYELALAHLTLKSTFGLEAAGKFMPHCTLFAFLHLKEGFGEKELIEVLDQLIPEYKAFPLNYSLKTEQFIRLELEKQPELMRLQAAIRQAIWPMLGEYGQFARRAVDFNPHITLAFRDLPVEPGLLEQVVTFCQKLYQKLPDPPLTARFVQLVEFNTQSESGWSAPDYWRTLSWRLVKGYILPDA